MNECTLLENELVVIWYDKWMFMGFVVSKWCVWLALCFQVCDSDTMLDPACSVEMAKVLEEDPMVGGVGGDVQVLGLSNYHNLVLEYAHL